jgi:pimeloyl-ACP methyl ester carboxylesterase
MGDGRGELREPVMPAVFVHGVPDTARVWGQLLGRLERTDVVRLSLPGFGSAPPAGFTPDKDGYANWLISELRQIPGPIDLVGHDWGSLLVTRAVSIVPDLVRTWCGGAAPLDPDYTWHDTARVWQTPGKGEALMQVFGGEALAQGLSTQGVPLDQARETANHIDETMKACILALYRSAIDVADDWFADLEQVRARGLVLWGERDPYASSRFGERLAQNVKGCFTQVPDAGHWYQIEQPAFVAQRLEVFWRRRD